MGELKKILGIVPKSKKLCYNRHEQKGANKMESVTKKLQKIQFELKAPKGQENKFGGYRYRSCEDIMEAVKPLLEKHGAALTVSDDIILVGDASGEKTQCRFYVKATATLRDSESGVIMAQTSAFAREPVLKKGMDESQITGAASSYARKYALNGLFCIDDTKDADTMDNRVDPVKKIQTLKDRIKALLDKIDPATDVSKFAHYVDCDDEKELVAIGIAVKKFVESGGQENANI
jgi:hypothetical protein